MEKNISSPRFEQSGVVTPPGWSNSTYIITHFSSSRDASIKVIISQKHHLVVSDRYDKLVVEDRYRGGFFVSELDRCSEPGFLSSFVSGETPFDVVREKPFER
ncbi:MAG: hypothetical protein GX421_11070 [Caldisericales bacterium]|nr:hypothetical protein [Caldisericales bacterium]